MTWCTMGVDGQGKSRNQGMESAFVKKEGNAVRLAAAWLLSLKDKPLAWSAYHEDALGVHLHD